MDLDYWNQFCNNYSVDILKYISQDGLNIIQKFLNKNVQFKGLQRILNLYFKPQPFLKCDYLQNVISLSYHKSLHYNKEIYIFGEVHNLNKSCSIKTNGCNVYDFIIDQISKIPKFIDVFVETVYVTKGSFQQKHETKENLITLKRFERDLENCLYKHVNCEYENIRFHNTDIRQTIYTNSPSKNLYLSVLFYYLLGFDYIVTSYVQGQSLYEESNYTIEQYKRYKNILLQVLNSKDLKSQQTEFDNLLNDNDKLVEYLLKMFSKFKLLKQQETIPEEVKIILLNYIIENTKTVNKSILSSQNILASINKLPNDKYPTIYESKDILDISKKITRLLVPIMDIYLISRMFRKFKHKPYYNSKEPKNIIIYVGDYHANIYRIILKHLNFIETLRINRNPGEYCIDISEIKLPLFS